MSTSTLNRPETPAPSPTTRPTNTVRTNKLIVIAAIAVPTLLILFVMSGLVESVGASSSFPWFKIEGGLPPLLQANTPTGGDMGAHVYLPKFLEETLLPAGRIMGWSQDWYAGFPALYFYFPIPALTTVALDVILPYGVAFKLTTIVGLLALPGCLYYFVRSMGFARLVSAMAAAFASGYVLMESFSIFGGNIKSTLAGEFSFGWSFAFSLLYLGAVLRDTKEGRGFTPRAGIFLALTALTHIVTTMVVVAVSVPLLARRNGARVLLRSWTVGFGIAAFWALPLAVRVYQGMTSDMNWSPVRGLVGEGSTPGTVATPLPNELIPIAILAIVGLVWTTVRGDRVWILATMTTLPLIGYWVLQLDGIELTKVYNARLLPYWYLGLFIFAGIALGLGVRAMVRYLPERRRNYMWGAVLTLVVIGNIMVSVVHDVPGWVRWNYTGFEAKEAWPEYEAIMETVDGLPPGRVMWEANSGEMGKYGTPLAFMLYPYWSEEHPTMEGLFFESSLTTPFHFLTTSTVSTSPSNPVRGLNYHNLDFPRGITYMQLYGVEYYAAWSEDTADMARAEGLEEVAYSEPVTFFRIPDNAMVDIAEFVPVVYDGEEPFLDAALNWYDDYRSTDHWMVAEGPADWPTVEDAAGPFDLGAPIDTTGAVSDIVIEHERISFHTTAVGVPHLVKVSYFPAWSVDGADGPYRAAPSLMMVVPTQEDVVLEFRNGVPENVGGVLTIVTVLGLGAWWFVDRRRRRHADVAAGMPSAVQVVTTDDAPEEPTVVDDA